MDFKQYENKHKGKRCFILGCAPSILEEDLSLLDNEIVVVCNKALLLTENGLKNYDYFFCTDPKVYKQIKNESKIPNDCVRVYSSGVSKLGVKENHISIKKTGTKLGISKIGESFYNGWGGTGTVAFEATITSFFMGFSEIYMLGVDLHYDSHNTHFYPTTPNSRENKFKHRMNENIQTIRHNIELINNRLINHNVKWCNLSSGFQMKELMQTDSLKNIICQ